MHRGLAYNVLSLLISPCVQEALHDGFVTHARGNNQCSAAILRFRNKAAIQAQCKKTELKRKGEAMLLPTRVFIKVGPHCIIHRLEHLFLRLLPGGASRWLHDPCPWP